LCAERWKSASKQPKISARSPMHPKPPRRRYMGMDVASIKAHSSARHELRSSGSDIPSVNLAPAAPGNRKKYTSEGFASLTLQRRTFDLA
jgi:hypothetical protein